MLTRIRLENFKSWRELDMDLAPLTLLFGTNSSGKSSVLQALLLLKQTANSFDRKQLINFGGSERDYVDLGSYLDLVYHHEHVNNVGIEFLWFDEHRWDYRIQWQFADREVILRRLYYNVYSHDYPAVLVSYQQNNQYAYEMPGEWSIYDSTSTTDAHNTPIVPPENCYRLPGKLAARRTASHDIGDWSIYGWISFERYNQAFEQLMERIVYLGPLRQYPKRSYLSSGSTPQAIKPDGENTIAALIASERSDGLLLHQVAQWLVNLQLVESIAVRPIDRDKRYHEIKVRVGAAESSLLDVGFGVSQVLPVITMLLTAPEGSIVLLEQPELHLHPGAQAHLADLLLQAAEERHLQLIVESHSEHLLRRIQRRIAEPEHAFANPDNIRMYFCQPGTDGSQIEQVQVDTYGQIANWPDNFFGDLLADLDAMTDAALARRRQELNGG